jgi:hypothetical protein
MFIGVKNFNTHKMSMICNTDCEKKKSERDTDTCNVITVWIDRFIET